MDSKESPKFEKLATKEGSTSLNQDKEQKTDSKTNIDKNTFKLKEEPAEGQKKRIKREVEIATIEYLRGEFYVKSEEYWKELDKLKILGPSPEVEVSISSSTILVLDRKGRPVELSLPFSGSETWEKFHQVAKRMGHKKVAMKELPINAVDQHNKTIAIRIYLNRKKEDIIQETRNLLEILDWEAKYFKINIKRPKPRLDVLQKALKVYDIREGQKLKGKTSWKRIASEVFDDVDIDVAISKARHHYNIAVKMIRGGWKDL